MIDSTKTEYLLYSDRAAYTKDKIHRFQVETTVPRIKSVEYAL